MRVGINASFLRKRATGIGQVTQHFLEELSHSLDELTRVFQEPIEFFVYLEEDAPTDVRMSPSYTVRALLPLLWKRDDLIRKILWETYTFPMQAKKDGCDVLLSLYQSATIAPRGMKHLMVVHDIIPHFFPEYLNNARKKLYQHLIEKAIVRADHVVAVSVKTEKDLIAHLGALSSKISVNPIDVDPIFKRTVSLHQAHEVLQKYSLHQGYIYAGGGLEKRKNIESLLIAYKLLLERNNKEKFVFSLPKLVISGKLMPELSPLIVDVERLVKEMNLSTCVRVLGFVPQEDLPALYNQALFFVFPSVYEGFGLPVLEAMSQGTPVLSSQTTSLPEVGKDAVMYCDPHDVDDIVRGMHAMFTNKEFRATLGTRGQLRSKDFSWSSFTRKIVRILSNMKVTDV